MTHVYVTWLIHVCHHSFIGDMTHVYVTWPVYMCAMTNSLVPAPPYVPTRMWHDSCICDMTHSNVTWLMHIWHDSFICDMTHAYLPWLIHVWHESCIRDPPDSYGVATISRLLKSTGLFCKRALQKRPTFFKETYNLKEPTNRSHPICDMNHSHATWLMHIGHDVFICAPWLDYERLPHAPALTHAPLHIMHDSFICDMTKCSELWFETVCPYISE